MRSHLQTTTDLNAVATVLEWFTQTAAPLNPPELVWQSQTILVEGFTHAVRHAHHNLPSITPIDLELGLYEHQVELRIWDWGQPFDLNAKVQEMIRQEPADPLEKETGRGLILIHKLTDELHYTRAENQRNCLVMRKHLLPSAF